ncbi:MAG: acyl-CoA thioesterase [Candidatus Nanopelagicales bacterium]
MHHITEIKVRGYHLDLYGHVNNARYLEFLEEARWTMTEERGDINAFLASGNAFVIVNMNITFRRPATVGDVLHIDTSVSKLGRSSMVLRQLVTLADSDVLVAEADSTSVLVDKSGSSVEIPALMREGLEGWRHG